jgi:RHS repeat-associated protein
MSTYQNLTYDAIGRLTNDDSIARSYHYDYRNMISLLTQAHNLPDGITRKDTMICTYNYKNQRVMKLQKHRWWNQMCGGGGGEMSQPQGGGTGKGTDAGGGTSLTMGPPSQLPEGCLVESMQATFYVWSGNEVIAEYNESNELKYQYVYANGMRIAQLKKNSGTSKDTTYLHPDYQGSTRLQTKPDKTTYAKIDYDVWGQVRQQSGYPSAYTYTGQEWDDENSTNLFYLHARYYDPVLGRFTTPDPIKDDWTPYSYVRNNPIAYNDPTGMGAFFNFSPPQGADLGGFYNGMSMDDVFAWGTGKREDEKTAAAMIKAGLTDDPMLEPPSPTGGNNSAAADATAVTPQPKSVEEIAMGVAQEYAKPLSDAADKLESDLFYDYYNAIVGAYNSDDMLPSEQNLHGPFDPDIAEAQRRASESATPAHRDADTAKSNEFGRERWRQLWLRYGQ